MTSNLLNVQDALLLIIDIQPKLLAAQPKGEKILKNAKKLASAAKILNIPTLVTEQYPQGLGNTDESLKAELIPTAEFFEKKCFSCCDQEAFAASLSKYNRKQIILLGVETHVCVHQSANSLVKAGYEVHIVEDACGSRNKFEHKIGLKRMINDGAVPSCVETVIFELLRTSANPDFKAVQSLIK